MASRVAIVTSIIGECDTLKEQCEQTIPVDFICFTDQDFKSDTWRIVKPLFHPAGLRNNNLKGLYYKLQTHKVLTEYDYIIYICGSVEIMNPYYAQLYIKDALRTGIANMAHPERKCAYEEMEYCKEIKKYQGEPIQKQIDFYKEQNFPADWGLWCCTDFIRACTPKIDVFFDMWWEHLNKYAINDQMSLPYIAWKTNLKPFTISGYQRNNRHYIKHPHIKSWDKLKCKIKK